MAQARADRAGRPGLLPALPVGVKDIIDTVDMPTEHGSPIYRGNRPLADAACVALIRAAGAVILGKTVTTEFANRHPGPDRATRTTRRTRPGGSSSGSAAAVADFQVPVALGTQTGGSMIRPAAFCGVVGYKPSFGEFSGVGIKMQCHNLDTLGIMAAGSTICRCCARPSSLPPVPIDRASRAAHRVLPHAGLGHADARYARAARAHRREVGGRRAGQRGRVRPAIRRHPRTPPPHLRFRGGAQLRLRIRERNATR